MMRHPLWISFAGHILVVVIGSALSHWWMVPPPAVDTIRVGLSVAPAQASEPEPIPEAPPEMERPAADPEPDVAPPPVEEELPEPELPAAELPPPPDVVRSERALEADATPADADEVAAANEVLALAPPDVDLPPPPVTSAELPEPERVQPEATEGSASETPVPTPEQDPRREELGEGAAVLASSQSELEDGYLSRVQQKIGRRWQPTPASALGQKYVATVVSFRIRPDGRVEAPVVSETSGLSVFDRQALRAVIDASPLPPLPPRYPDGVHINFRFEYER